MRFTGSSTSGARTFWRSSPTRVHALAKRARPHGAGDRRERSERSAAAAAGGAGRFGHGRAVERRLSSRGARRAHGRERTATTTDFARRRRHRVADALESRFVLRGQYAPHRRRRARRARHRMSRPITSSSRFRITIRWAIAPRAIACARSCRPDALRLAAALLLLAPYVPMLFMGEEYGERAPFLYFVSHSDPDLVEAVRTGRREEFASFGWAGEVPDPQVGGDVRALAHPLRAGERGRAREAARALSRAARDSARGAGAPPWCGAHHACERDASARWIAMRLDAPGARSLLALFNLADRASARFLLGERPMATGWRARFVDERCTSAAGR